MKYTHSLCLYWNTQCSTGSGTVLCCVFPWFQKLPVFSEYENSVFPQTLVGLGVLPPVFRSFQNWQFLNQSAKLLPKIETLSRNMPDYLWCVELRMLLSVQQMQTNT